MALPLVDQSLLHWVLFLEVDILSLPQQLLYEEIVIVLRVQTISVHLTHSRNCSFRKGSLQ